MLFREQIISDEDVARVHGSADFGDMTARRVVDQGVSNVALGYHCGSVMQSILIEHGLAWPRSGESPKHLKPKGQRYHAAMQRAGVEVVI